MKSLSRFILIDNSNKKQLYLQWKTNYQQMHKPDHLILNDFGYSTRKNIISELVPIDNGQNIRRNNTSQKQLRISATSSKTNLNPFYTNPEKQNSERQSRTVGKTFYRAKSFGRVSVKSQKCGKSRSKVKNNEIKAQDIQKLTKTITNADRKNGKAICILKMRRNGLRYKITNNFFVVCKDTDHEELAKQVKAQLFGEYSFIGEKKVYLFHLSKQPINNICKDLSQKQYVIFADTSPKFDIPFEMQMQLFEEALIWETKLKESASKLQSMKNQFENNQTDSSEPPTACYEWQKIKNVKQYVDKLIQNPKATKQLKGQKTQKEVIELWCQQHYTPDEQKRDDKNPFLDVQSHFPKETAELNILEQAAVKIGALPTTINKHQIKHRPVFSMAQKLKRESEYAEQLKQEENKKFKMLGYKCEKQFTRQLDAKNIPLTYQNIPYIMEKYGINRAEVYNLYNLYKSLQKISAMRLIKTNEHRSVKQRGIDRKTFDEGVKGLQINPGEELIRNICYFPDFVSWEQFIKIVSISMRKTPQSKLQAILQGLGSHGNGCLSLQQIDIMVGSSLQKILGKNQPDLRKHFVNLVMKKMDKDNSGTIDIQELKSHVLERGIQNLDLVSYLMLNS